LQKCLAMKEVLRRLCKSCAPSTRPWWIPVRQRSRSTLHASRRRWQGSGYRSCRSRVLLVHAWWR
jgi:hypothetical protein